jgi:CheY-like chemotaxis protein
MKKILVVDDEKAIRNSFKLTFEGTNFNIVLAENGKEALGKLDENHYDLIFLDLKMPEMNGVEVLSKIRKKNKEVPIYLITAFQKEFLNELNDARNAGYTFELLNKPLKREELRNIVDCILSDY